MYTYISSWNTSKKHPEYPYLVLSRILYLYYKSLLFRKRYHLPALKPNRLCYGFYRGPQAISTMAQQCRNARSWNQSKAGRPPVIEMEALEFVGEIIVKRKNGLRISEGPENCGSSYVNNKDVCIFTFMYV